MDTLVLLAVVTASYLIGSISPGIMLGRRLKGIDIRQHGSGNTGATNVLRIIGPGAAGIAFLVDALKGALAVWLGNLTGNAAAPLLCGFAAITGHNWPVFTGFRGGKGMATAAGIVFTLFPGMAGILLLVFVVVVALTRYVSLASILASAAVVPALLITRQSAIEVAFGVGLAALIIWRHKANIARLMQGTESKIGSRTKG